MQLMKEFINKSYLDENLLSDFYLLLFLSFYLTEPSDRTQVKRENSNLPIKKKKAYLQRLYTIQSKTPENIFIVCMCGHTVLGRQASDVSFQGCHTTPLHSLLSGR